MPPTKESVIQKVRKAFEGVTLGSGVGLLQGQAYDGGRKGSEERFLDEKFDWTKISISKLDECSSSLCFFDAEGMRFHLPAYLIADLEGGLNRSDTVFHLTDLSNYKMNQLAALSASQKEAVREFLLLRLRDPDHHYDWRAIEKALGNYW